MHGVEIGIPGEDFGELFDTVAGGIEQDDLYLIGIGILRENVIDKLLVIGCAGIDDDEFADLQVGGGRGLWRVDGAVLGNGACLALTTCIRVGVIHPAFFGLQLAGIDDDGFVFGTVVQHIYRRGFEHAMFRHQRRPERGKHLGRKICGVENPWFQLLDARGLGRILLLDLFIAVKDACYKRGILERGRYIPIALENQV